MGEQHYHRAAVLVPKQKSVARPAGIFAQTRGEKRPTCLHREAEWKEWWEWKEVVLPGETTVLGCLAQQLSPAVSRHCDGIGSDDRSRTQCAEFIAAMLRINEDQKGH